MRTARPGRLPPPETLAGQVAVLDLAFQAQDPERDLAWAAALGERLAAWVDHHDQPAWERVAADPRFLLVPRREAPACPPLVTAEVVAAAGPVRTVLCHGDLDGVLSAAKWLLLAEGLEPPAWLDPDSIAADTRRAELTPRGERLDRALRSAPGKQRLARAVAASVLAEARGLAEAPEVAALLDRAVAVHEHMLANAARARELVEALPDAPLDTVLVDLRVLPAGLRLDLTALLLELQQEHDLIIAIVRAPRGRFRIVASTAPERSGLDLREFFGIHGFAPFRVHLEPEVLLRRVPARRLEQVLRGTAPSRGITGES